MLFCLQRSHVSAERVKNVNKISQRRWMQIKQAQKKYSKQLQLSLTPFVVYAWFMRAGKRWKKKDLQLLEDIAIYNSHWVLYLRIGKMMSLCMRSSRNLRFLPPQVLSFFFSVFLVCNLSHYCCRKFAQHLHPRHHRRRVQFLLQFRASWVVWLL